MNAARPVRLHIERLVLSGAGFDRAQAALFQRAMERELTRLLSRSPLPAGGYAADRLAAPSPRPGASGPAAQGVAAARSLHAALRAGAA